MSFTSRFFGLLTLVALLINSVSALVGRHHQPRLKRECYYHHYHHHTALASSSRKLVSVADEGRASIKKWAPALLSIAGFMLSTKVVKAESYLSDPTADFKAEQAKSAALQKEQAKIRKEWDAIMVRLDAAEESGLIAQAIRDLQAVLEPLNGVPSGVKKRDMVKACRKKKFKDIVKLRGILPSWTTECELAYEKLIRTFHSKITPEGLDKNPTF